MLGLLSKICRGSLGQIYFSFLFRFQILKRPEGLTPHWGWIQMCLPCLWGISAAFACPMGPKIWQKYTCPGYQSWFRVVLVHFQFQVYIFPCKTEINLSFWVGNAHRYNLMTILPGLWAVFKMIFAPCPGFGCLFSATCYLPWLCLDSGRSTSVSTFDRESPPRYVPPCHHRYHSCPPPKTKMVELSTK